MKLMFFLLFVSLVFSQSIKEEMIHSASIRYSFSDPSHQNEFLALPSNQYKIVSQKGVSLTRSFSKLGNDFYELLFSETNSSVIVEFFKSVHSFQRRSHSLAANKLFSSSQKKKINTLTAQFPRYIYDENTLKIATDKSGLYRISHDYLTSQNLRDFKTLNTSHLRLYNNGLEVPFFIASGNNNFIDEADEFLLFYGEPHLNSERNLFDDVYYDPYDDRNIYWLSYEPHNTTPPKRLFKKNASLKEIDDEVIFRPDYFNSVLHLEKNIINAQSNLIRVEAFAANKGFYHHRDFGLWGQPVSGGEFQNYEVPELDNLYHTGDSIDVSIMLSGGHSVGSQKHKLEVKISSFSYTSPSQLNWSQSHKQRLNFRVPITSLKRTGNDFAIKVISSGEVFLNFIELKMPHQFLVTDNTLEFLSGVPVRRSDQKKALKTFEYTLNGFEGSAGKTPKIYLVKKNEALLSGYKITKEKDQFNIHFQDEIENINSEFIVATEEQLNVPLEIIPVKTYQKPSELAYLSTGLRNHRSEAQMLVITARPLLEDALKFAKHRTSTGIHTEVVLDEHIYNEYNNGFQSPFAIKRFIKDAFELWSEKNQLTYLYFLGDSKRSYHAGVRNPYHIPTFQFLPGDRTGYVASDTFYGYLYSQENEKAHFLDNQIMDLYVGRLPAESSLDASAYLNKVIEYEKAVPQYQSLILIGNDSERRPDLDIDKITGKRVFVDQSARINHTVSNETDYIIQRRASDEDPVKAPTALHRSEQLRAIFEEGINHISFLGHGGGAIWGDNYIMDQESARMLQNTGKYPIVSSLTCFIGAFDERQRTLGEVLVMQPDKGAVGLLGSSSVGLIYNQYMMSYYLNRHLSKKKYSYGEALSLAKLDYYNKGSRYVVDEGTGRTPGFESLKEFILLAFNYIGDPSLSLKFPETAKLTVHQEKISKNATLNYTLSGFPSGNYAGEIEFFTYHGEPLQKKEIAIENSNQFQSDLTLDVLGEHPVHFLKGYFISSDKKQVYNFGKKLVTTELKQIDRVAFIDAESGDEILLNTDVTNELKIALSFSEHYSNITARLIGYDINRNEIRNMNLSFEKSGDSYISETSFRFESRILFIDVVDIQGIKNEQTIRFGNYSVDVTPTRYTIQPIKNSFKLEYTDITKLSAGVKYSLSYKDTLDVYADYYASYQFPDEQKAVWLGKDTVHFQKRETNKFSSISVKEHSQAVNQARYYVKLSTDSISKEGFSREDQTDSLLINDFPNIRLNKGLIESKTISIRDGVQLIYKSHGKLLNESSLTFMGQKTLKHLIPTDKMIPNSDFFIHYYHPELSFNAPDTNTFVIEYSKPQWINYKNNRLGLYYFNESFGKWVEQSSSLRIKEDSTLQVFAKNGLTHSGYYALQTYSKDQNPFRVVVAYEVNGEVGNTVFYSGTSPSVQIKVNTKDEGYTLNHENIRIELEQGETTKPLAFAPTYVGEDGKTLNLVLDREEFSKDEHYQLKTTVHGFVRVVGENALNENSASQVIRVSSTDELIVYGNYPNPFSDHTIIAYQLHSSNIDDAELSLKIYTLSGHLIRTMDETSASVIEASDSRINFKLLGHSELKKIGPNYLVWDGKDRYGNDVANGVYFAKLRYKSNGKIKEKIMKLAKVKGVASGNFIEGLK